MENNFLIQFSRSVIRDLYGIFMTQVVYDTEYCRQFLYKPSVPFFSNDVLK